MNTKLTRALIIISSEEQQTISNHIWGTGGWLAPEQREGLDWLTLIKLLGWKAEVASIGLLQKERIFFDAYTHVILACELEELSINIVKQIVLSFNNNASVLITRPGNTRVLENILDIKTSIQRIKGKQLAWNGKGLKRKWDCRKNIEFYAFDNDRNCEVWATLDGRPIILAKHFHKGTVVSLSFHPSNGRDQEGAITALLKHLLVWYKGEKYDHLDFNGCMVLRMDDPGAAQNVYSNKWAHQKLNQKTWRDIGEDLKQRKGKMSVAYVSGVIDDGDAHRGKLKIKGVEIERVPGKVYPSPLVEYQDINGHIPGSIYNFEEEYECIQELRRRNLISVELHGYTHMNPDTVAWSNADDRYNSVYWFRELGQAGQKVISKLQVDEHPLNLGVKTLQEFFKIYPTTLVCPGDQWTNEVLEYALELKIKLIGSYYLAIRHKDMFCWAYHVCAPYLDKPDPTWFDSELPVIGYLHDRDIAIYGIEWFRTNLDKWQEAGALKFIDFKELVEKLETNNQ